MSDDTCPTCDTRPDELDRLTKQTEDDRKLIIYLRERVALLEDIAKASEKGLCAAASRAGIGYYGLATPTALADEVEDLRDQVETLESKLADYRTVVEAAKAVIADVTEQVRDFHDEYDAAFGTKSPELDWRTTSMTLSLSRLAHLRDRLTEYEEAHHE